jgi:hypothetical protein
MDMYHGTQLSRKACSSKPGKGFVHDRDGTNLFLGEFVGPLKIVYFDFSGICGRLKYFRLGIPGIDSG